MKDIEIIEGNQNQLKQVYPQFKKDFTPDEQKSYQQLETLFAKKKYKLLLAKDKTIHEVVGYAFIYELEPLSALWLDYLAINQKYQNLGYGTLLFNKIAQSNHIGIFMEVEIPEGQRREEQLRRIHFYERLGAKKLQIPYKLPTNHGGFPMYLYFKNAPNVEQLHKEQLQEAITDAFHFIHSDVKNRDTILTEFLPSIMDEHF